MAKIVSMSSGAIDPIAVTKRVFWRPVTSATVLKVGQPVCYNSDAVVDHKERTSDPAHIGITQHTYAQGAQDFTGRLFIVEEPLTANLHAFAGFVKSLGPKAGADGDMIEIFIPNGAIIPVWTDLECTEDRTIIGIRNGEADASFPGRAVGIAKESKDRSSTNGLVWAKVSDDLFMYQYQASSLNVPDEATAYYRVNYCHVTTAHSGGSVKLLDMKLTLTGTGNASRGGCAAFQTIVSAAITGVAHGICSILSFTDDAGMTATYSEMSAALCLIVETKTTTTAADFTGLGIAAISIGLYLDESVGAPTHCYPIQINTDSSKAQFDGLFRAERRACIGMVACGGDHTILTSDYLIPINVQGTTYYILALASNPNE